MPGISTYCQKKVGARQLATNPGCFKYATWPCIQPEEYKTLFFNIFWCYIESIHPWDTNRIPEDENETNVLIGVHDVVDRFSHHKAENLRRSAETRLLCGPKFWMNILSFKLQWWTLLDSCQGINKHSLTRNVFSRFGFFLLSSECSFNLSTYQLKIGLSAVGRRCHREVVLPVRRIIEQRICVNIWTHFVLGLLIWMLTLLLFL